MLGPDAACGPDALKGQDLPRDRHPRVPGDWPGVPLMISSPDLPPSFSGDTIEVRVPMADLPGLREASFDGVTAGLRVNGNLHAPLLCVAQVFDVATFPSRLTARLRVPAGAAGQPWTTAGVASGSPNGRSASGSIRPSKPAMPPCANATPGPT